MEPSFYTMPPTFPASGKKCALTRLFATDAALPFFPLADPCWAVEFMLSAWEIPGVFLCLLAESTVRNG